MRRTNASLAATVRREHGLSAPLSAAERSRRERTSGPVEPRQMPPPASASRASASLQPLTFSLAPGGSRALRAGQAVALPTDAGSVQLELQWPAALDASYRAVMMTPDGDEVWRSANVIVRQRGESTVLGLTLDPPRMPPGDYVIRVSARSPNGVWQDVADYAFRLKRLER